MGIFNFDKEDKFPSTEDWEKMSHEEKIREITKSIIYILGYYPDVAYGLETEIRRIKINKITNNNEVRTVSKRRPRTNLPPPNPSVPPQE
jgi:hypothetical protein